MKLIINAEANMLSVVFSAENPDHYKVVEPDLIYYYTNTGQLTEIDIPNLSKHLGGQKPKALELNLAPDHSNSVFEVDLPLPVQELIKKASSKSPR